MQTTNVNKNQFVEYTYVNEGNILIKRYILHID